MKKELVKICILFNYTFRASNYGKIKYDGFKCVIKNHWTYNDLFILKYKNFVLMRFFFEVGSDSEINILSDRYYVSTTNLDLVRGFLKKIKEKN